MQEAMNLAIIQLQRSVKYYDTASLIIWHIHLSDRTYASSASIVSASTDSFGFIAFVRSYGANAAAIYYQAF